MSSWLVFSSAAAAIVVAALCMRAYEPAEPEPPPGAEQLMLELGVTEKQATLVLAGVPTWVAISVPDGCDLDVNVGREFPFVVVCPEAP